MPSESLRKREEERDGLCIVPTSRKSWKYAVKLCDIIIQRTVAEGANITKNGCPSKCGELRVPYHFEFGINSDCFTYSFFAINCDASSIPPKAFLSTCKVETFISEFLGSYRMQKTSSHLFLCFLYLAWIFSEGANISKPGCPSKCGDITVPYPFGIGMNSGCSIDPFFTINCDASFDPPKAFLSVDKVEVLGISDTKISVKTRLSEECYTRDGTPMHGFAYSMDFSSTPFSFSNENKLTVVGCDDAAFLARNAGDHDHIPDLISSCVAICSKPGELRNGFCSGIGCCQSSIPDGLQSVYIFMTTVMEHRKVSNFSSCGYSFLAEQSSYNFNTSDISDTSFVSRITETVPVAIDWAIGNKACNEIKNPKEIICQPNSVCVDSESTLGGYRCNCSSGYQGNPYLSPGVRRGEREFRHESIELNCYGLLPSPIPAPFLAASQLYSRELEKRERR